MFYLFDWLKVTELTEDRVNQGQDYEANYEEGRDYIDARAADRSVIASLPV